MGRVPLGAFVIVLAIAAILPTAHCNHGDEEQGEAAPPFTMAPTAPAPHPLDSLDRAEVAETKRILEASGRLHESHRYVELATVELRKGAPQSRIVRAVVYDWRSGITSVARIDLNRTGLLAWTDIGRGDPPNRDAIASRLNEVVANDPRWLEALRARGVADPKRVVPLARLHEGAPLEERDGSRFVWARAFHRDLLPPHQFVRGLELLANLTSGEVALFRFSLNKCSYTSLTSGSEMLEQHR